MKVDKYIFRSLTYFAQFNYAPTSSQLHRSLPCEISLTRFLDHLNHLCRNSDVVRISDKNNIDATARYTLPQYSITPVCITEKYMRAQTLKRSVSLYIAFLRWFPLVRAVYITGSMAYKSAQEGDDIDLFIITSQGCVWTTRLICIIVAEFLGVRQKGGVCLNLFFENTHLTIPPIKRTAYVALELRAARQLIDKDAISSSLYQANSWVYRYYPNDKPHWGKKKQEKSKTVAPLTGMVNAICRLLQLPLIRHNRTGFLIGRGQLWLFAQDHETALTIRPPVI